MTCEWYRQMLILIMFYIFFTTSWTMQDISNIMDTWNIKRWYITDVSLFIWINQLLTEWKTDQSNKLDSTKSTVNRRLEVLKSGNITLLNYATNAHILYCKEKKQMYPPQDWIFLRSWSWNYIWKQVLTFVQKSFNRANRSTSWYHRMDLKTIL